MTTTSTAPAGVFTAEQAAGILREHGFTIHTTGELTQAVRVFQDCWRLGPRLRVDGVVGPATTAALARAERARRDGQPTASAHFSYSEFACHCRGSLPGCRGLLLVGALIDALEVLRTAAYPDGLHVVSGYRCPQHNAVTPGAHLDSQHLHGGGCDIAPRLKVKALARLRVFSGLGYGTSSGLVCHVDVRHASGYNSTGSTVVHPESFPDGP